jgi:hypothetical protein
MRVIPKGQRNFPNQVQRRPGTDLRHWVQGLCERPGSRTRRGVASRLGATMHARSQNDAR